MALFVLTYGYHDTPLRAERREDHLAHLNKLWEQGSLVAAGPFTDLTAGLIVLRAEDEAAARALVDQDPYTQLEVTKDRSLREWRVTVGSLD
ncbi:YciI family protein [Nonomuraea gerenzanensis]|uniref:YCII-related n=1 Tax=Nonomuraea gerenzanensis TaxID=93944 RepID=A0A1M4EIP1_9ACTN|nr:YciI family protein [Nonomuraea gerenzanensis]UBU10278.1 YciI family protein [Nonomuraea gerenzanensis]SBO98662.1 YCII-related [Nonomuraea gerenzanensis]